MQKRKFCVIGVGNFGFHVAAALFEDGHEVVAVDTDREKVQAVRDHCTYALQGDAAQRGFLEANGLREMDAVVVSTGERSHLSTLITLYLSEMKVPSILVKALDEDHGRILRSVGATQLIFPEKDMARKVASNLSRPNVLEYIALAAEYSLTENIPPLHFVGKTLVELDLRRRFNVNVVAIRDVMRNRFIPVPTPDYRIKDSDLLLMIGKTSDLDAALAP